MWHAARIRNQIAIVAVMSRAGSARFDFRFDHDILFLLYLKLVVDNGIVSEKEIDGTK